MNSNVISTMIILALVVLIGAPLLWGFFMFLLEDVEERNELPIWEFEDKA